MNTPLHSALRVQRPDLAAAVGRLSRANVLVLGDAMLDRYVFGQVSRISPEAPVPVLLASGSLSEPGGAGNVVHNLCALGVAAAFVSVVGDDQTGSELTALIGGQPGVEPWLLVQGGRITTEKTRFLVGDIADGGQQLLRTDREDPNPIQARLIDRMLRIAGDAMAATSLTILSDYRKGVLAGDTPARMIAAARATGRPIVVDVRGSDYERFAGADVLIAHCRDISEAAELPIDDDTQIAAAAAKVAAMHGFRAVVVTRAEGGMSLVAGDVTAHFPGRAFDSVSAGDTAVAVIGAALAAGIELPVAVELATLAAGIALDKVGTAVARADKLLLAANGT